MGIKPEKRVFRGFSALENKLDFSLIILLTKPEKRATFLPAASQPHKMKTLKEIMTTAELLEINETQAVHFAFSRMEGKSFKGNTATLVCNYFGKILGQWICQESGEMDATWKCEWA